ncbi:hypothetical protein GCM10009641_10870 [Mycobacterium cookii]|uniref:Uncharacterized protein n=1 Tax=Mycobacterium cookii TaxID=1775 RepID=A0A7I7L267_9MYCO|nr:hypothetical protein [Mycobacterium cookii]MCV7329727.1 hypothetical protein [Mycobacterium cookii]BBX47868.1 hypothetical protein MCOO_38830 [Mycobacterium cookii]
MRFALTILLWLFTTVALAVAVPTAWTQTHVVDVNGYAALARQAAGNPELQTAVASELATRATLLINQRGYRVDSGRVHNVAVGYTAGPDFPSQFADANRLAHDWMFTGAHAQSEGDQWVVDLAGMLKDSAFASLLAAYRVQVPDTVRVPVTVSTPKALQPGELRLLAKWGPWATIGVTALAGIGALLTLASARSRGRALAGLGISALLVGAAGWVGIEVARHAINDTLNDTAGDIRRIADVMVGQARASLHHWLDLSLAAGAALVVLGVSAALLGGLRK